MLFNKRIGAFIDKIHLTGAYISGAFMVLISLSITYDVCARYFFSAPQPWVFEISTYLCIVILFLGGGYVLKEKGHISVDTLVSKIPERTKLILECVTSVLAFIFSFILAWDGGMIALSAYQQGETSPTILRIPMFIPRGLVSLGGILLCFQLIRNFKSLLFQIKNIGNRDNQIRSQGNKGKTIISLFVIVFIISFLLLTSRGFSLIGIWLLLFLLFFSGLPVAFVMGFTGIAGLYFLCGGYETLGHVPLIVYKSLDDFALVAVPLYIMTAQILFIGGVGANLFEVASVFTRHLPGGLGVATIFACAIFAAICGGSSAAVVSIGALSIPAMLSKGYRRDFTYGVIAVGGVLGPLIPPSNFMILIGFLTGDSIAKLFMAGMFPGIMLAIFFSIYSMLKAASNPDWPKVPKASWKERIHAIKNSIWGLFTPVIIIGGIYTGIFTTTEAAAVAGVYAFFICIFLYRTIKWRKFKRVLLDTSKTTAVILFIIAGAMTFSHVITQIKIADHILSFITTLPFHPMVILGIVLFFIIILGALMDEPPILFITYPILHYIFVINLGYDPIWFALVYVFTLEVGLIAPPVAIQIFLVQSVDRSAKYGEVVRGIWPYTLIMIGSILIVVFIKPLSTWLPQVMMK